jgi:streptogramin lyase
MLSRRIVTALLAAFAALVASASPASAAPAIDGQFPLVSQVDTNSKIAAGPDGNVWLAVHGVANDVARVTPAGEVTEFELEGIEQLSGIAAGPEGKVWVTATNKVASFSPSDPKASSKAFTINDVTSNAPIVAGPDGQMWVAASNNVVHFSPADPEGSHGSFPVGGLQPRDIDVAGSLLAIADAGEARIVTMTTAGVEKDFSIGHEKEGKFVGASQGVAGSPSGQIAFSDPGATPESIGLITPPNPAQEFERDGDPFGAAYGSDGAFWFPLFGGASPAGVERLTSAGTHTSLGGLKPGFGARQITAGPNNTMWMTAERNGEEHESEVVRISGLEPPVAVPISGPAKPKAPETKISKGPKKTVKTKGKKAKVSFKFSSSAAGASFECALVKMKKGKKQPKPKFKGCKSPKTYKLKPGKYRFSVRAVLSGVADPSPATKTFKVVHVKG